MGGGSTSTWRPRHTKGRGAFDVHTRVRRQTPLCMFKCFCTMQDGRSYSSAVPLFRRLQVQVYTWAERTCISHRRRNRVFCCCKYAPFCNLPAFPLHPPNTQRVPPHADHHRGTPALVPYCTARFSQSNWVRRRPAVPALACAQPRVDPLDETGTPT